MKMHHSEFAALRRDMTRIGEAFALIIPLLEKENEITKLRQKFGGSLIRVHWTCAETMRENQSYRHVCTWADGDEGFVLKDG